MNDTIENYTLLYVMIHFYPSNCVIIHHQRLASRLVGPPFFGSGDSENVEGHRGGGQRGDLGGGSAG
jgi:hypothetical protein